jgi:hypothetical protein
MGHLQMSGVMPSGHPVTLMPQRMYFAAWEILDQAEYERTRSDTVRAGPGGRSGTARLTTPAVGSAQVDAAPLCRPSHDHRGIANPDGTAASSAG